MYMSILLLYTSVHYVHGSALGGEKRTTRPPEFGVMDSCEEACGCWKLNLGPLQEQQALLTMEAISLTPRILVILKVIFNGLLRKLMSYLGGLDIPDRC